MFKTGGKRIGRTDIEAQQVTTNLLVLNGHRFTSDDLLRRSAPAMLVQPQPQPVAPSAPAVVDDRRLAALETALQETRDAIAARSVQLERTAVKRNRHWYVAGKRVNASDLRGDSRRFFSVLSYSSVTAALQSLAEEIDALHGATKSGIDESSNSQTN